MSASVEFHKGIVRELNTGFGYTFVLCPDSGKSFIELPKILENYIDKNITIEIKVIE